jgi:hypothetical protein
MSKSRHHRGLLGRRSGTVTVIEDRVHRSQVRNAKITFWVALVIVGLVAASIAADTHHPIVALFLGAGIGLAVALPVAALVAIWPVLRVLWWWTPEITLVLLLVYGWVITNRTGSLPLILMARPIPVGERLWVWLRPGLCLDDLQSRLEEIAVACWAATVTAEKASESNAALVRLDIKRRDALKGTVTSPLVEQIDPNTPQPETTPVEIPTALDLPDVAATTVGTVPTPRRDKKPERGTEAAPANARANGAGGEDLSDWLD